MSEQKLVYPDWVQQYRVRGTTVKKKADNYYLYKRTSKRVPGKKYPQPVDTYIGVITPEGVIDAQKKVVPAVSGCEVYEYGFSKTIQTICPEQWKTANGKDWQKILFVLISKHSELSYIKHEFVIPDEKEFRTAWNSQYASLIRDIYKQYKVQRSELEKLKTIFIVYIGKSRFMSHISEEQKNILNRLNISGMEVH